MNIAIDIDQTLRNLNKQINAVWERSEAYGNGHPLVEDDTESEHDLKQMVSAKFGSVQERNAFFFEAYPFELYGSTPCMTQLGYVELDRWGKCAEDAEFELNTTIKHTMYVPFVCGLAIKASLFYLSKYCMFRNYVFPKYCEEIWEGNDVVVTANDKIATSDKKTDKQVLICIATPLNKKCQDEADLVYDNLEDMVEDLEDYSKLKEILDKKADGTYVKGEYRAKPEEEISTEESKNEEA